NTAPSGNFQLFRSNLHQLDAAVFGPAFVGFVGGNGGVEAVAEGDQTAGGDMVLCDQLIDDRLRAGLGELQIADRVADHVGVADDIDLHCGVVGEQLGDLVDGR